LKGDWSSDVCSSDLDGRCVQGQDTHSPQRADLRLLVIPTSYKRVAAYNLNYENF